MPPLHSGSIIGRRVKLLKAKVLTERQPFLPVLVPEELYFADLREAEVKLGYGTHYDYEYNQGLLKLISRSHHRIGVINLSDTNSTLQLISIKFDKRNFPERYGQTYQVRADTLNIYVNVNALGELPFATRVRIIDNTIGIKLGESDLLAVITGSKSHQ